MIIVKLQGGLGNQLFQYAAGRSLSIAKKTGLLLDISGFENTPGHITKRHYELDCFDINAEFLPGAELAKYSRFSLAGKLLHRILPNHRKRFYNEPHFYFDKHFFHASSNAFLVGYWQSEKYFRNIADTIRRDLAFRSETIERNRQLSDNISAVDSVSIHVRRGDYVNDAHTASMHGSCSLEYYHAAVELMHARVANMHLFVFSDDISWARENLKFVYPTTFVADRDAKAIDDLYLMSRCKHQVIANSSFSWWGAWLNSNSGKNVIAPSRWFGEFKADTKDLYPAGWIKI